MYKVLMTALLLLAAVSLAFAGGNQEEEAPQEFDDPDRVIELTAEDMEFFLEHGDEPNPELTVQEGEIVEIRLRVAEGTHDWVVDEFQASTEMTRAGGSTSVVFEADQTGEFEYYCSVASHRALGMYGTLVVQ